MKVSEYFHLGLTQGYLDFVDVPLNTDLPVFVDPSAIRTLQSPWGAECLSSLQNFFSCVLRNISEDNIPQARQLMSKLSEHNEFHFGLSVGESRGHAIGDKYADLILDAIGRTSAATTGLLEDLEDTCLLIHGIGPDLISDAICNIIRGQLIKYTQDICNYYGIALVPSVASGAMWDGVSEQWIEDFVSLPMADSEPLILVPRSIVRVRFSFDSQKYYRHYLLPEMQSYELSANTALVRTLKNGDRKPPTKKRLMEIYGSTKDSVIAQTNRFQETFQRYKREVRLHVADLPSDDDFSTVAGNATPIDWDSLVENLRQIPAGSQYASAYHNHVEKIFFAIFFPHLINPIKEYDLHSGRKRVDIRMTNEAKKGFFYWLSMHYPSQFVWIECKNYSDDVANEEVDQLSGRFSPTRGQFGLLVCRKIKNKIRLNDRCKDTAKDHRGFIIALDDEDVIELINYVKDNKGAGAFPKLRAMFENLIS